jgi:hypothetical protein
VFIDFETFPDGTPILDSTPITTQFPGLTFTNATVITAGISLNEFEFPPHSGTNVVFDDGGPISLSFATPVSSFGGYFTYLEPLTLVGFDTTSTQVASATSAFSSNAALFGDPGSSPNEFLSVAFTGGISSVTITADPLGGKSGTDGAFSDFGESSFGPRRSQWAGKSGSAPSVPEIPEIPLRPAARRGVLT